LLFGRLPISDKSDADQDIRRAHELSLMMLGTMREKPGESFGALMLGVAGILVGMLMTHRLCNGVSREDILSLHQLLADLTHAEPIHRLNEEVAHV
jgi:hypothetical protein